MNSNINTFIMDFDGTLVDSIKAYCAAYNQIYGHRPSFKPANPDLVSRWDLKDQCPLENDPERMFSSDEFWDHLELMPGAKEFMDHAKENHDVWICSIGTPLNIAKKALWIEKNLNHKQIILLSKNKADMGKDFIYFDQAVLVDDHEKNLFGAGIQKKICFGRKYDWNKNWDDLRAADFNELTDMLLTNQLLKGA